MTLPTNEMLELADESDILPCPFCGEPPFVEQTGFHLGGRTIRCETDDCMGPHTTARCINDAVMQWNRRSSQNGERERVIEEALFAVITFVGKQKPDELDDDLLYGLLAVEKKCRTAYHALKSGEKARA